MQLSNGAVYDVGHLCLNSEGVRLVDTARNLRRQSDEIADVIRAEQRYEQSLVSNAVRQQSNPYADDQFWQTSQRFWENEVAETGVELNRVENINQDIQVVNNIGLRLRASNGPVELIDATKAELSSWEWAIGTSGLWSR
ncbi:MAG: hypothetical protein F6K11_33445 [Leptolyngbya sp. SIO3F4]|nr:hypothetical protein [Leptolyngbya sp. SIO3F4]